MSQRNPAWWKSTEAMVAGILLIAMVLIGLVNPAFWSLDNLFSLARSNVVIGIMALGVLLIMISGGIDVSFPAFAVAAMYLVVRAMVDYELEGIVWPFLAATLIGAALGLVNAGLVHKLNMIPLIVTLGTAAMARGLLNGVVGTSNVNINKFPDSLIEVGKADLVTLTNAKGGTFGLTATVLVYLGLALMVHLVLSRTMIGRSVYAYGASPEAAKRVGFRTGRTLIFAYVTAGALAGFAGLLHSSMIWMANPRDFVGWELDVIAAVVLGGASIFGGRGSVLGTMLGVFILVMIKNSLILMGIDTTWQRVVVGLMLIAAVALTALRDRKAIV
ncbi:ABC transporter permease [Paracoccus sediminicola]|uniref:ABC transporter permease n=1 Tax=Paracoccus sediminicola TaxID=3017783 RepID=UPI0022F0A4CD|nr:ABC transporter permease [Paracoccus sediminicola]WBU56324.1 ABC transporter permease [Paracoccus sediminicola]